MSPSHCDVCKPPAGEPAGEKQVDFDSLPAETKPRIEARHPLSSGHAYDARYIWPQRWEIAWDIIERLAEKLEAKDKELKKQQRVSTAGFARQAKRITQLEAYLQGKERRWGDYFSWEREYEKQAGELEASRESQNRLHRRCQTAERAARATIEQCKREGINICRVLLAEQVREQAGQLKAKDNIAKLDANVIRQLRDELKAKDEALRMIADLDGITGARLEYACDMAEQALKGEEEKPRTDHGKDKDTVD